MHRPLGNCASHCALPCDSHESVNLQAILPLIRKIYHSVVLKDTAKYRQKARQNDHTERSKPKFYSIFWALLLEKRTFKRLFLYVWFCTDLAPIGRYRHDLRPREILEMRKNRSPFSLRALCLKSGLSPNVVEVCCEINLKLNIYGP